MPGRTLAYLPKRAEILILVDDPGTDLAMVQEVQQKMDKLRAGVLSPTTPTLRPLPASEREFMQLGFKIRQSVDNSPG